MSTANETRRGELSNRETVLEDSPFLLQSDQLPRIDANDGKTVLVVEDDAQIRTLVRITLTAKGYRVLEAGDGMQALELGRAYPGPIDLLITDIGLPKMGGPTLATRLTGLRPRIRVLFISGHCDQAIVRYGMTDTPSEFLRKPFSMAAIGSKVQSVLLASEQLDFDVPESLRVLK